MQKSLGWKCAALLCAALAGVMTVNGAEARTWRQEPFYFIQSELSPATLFHCASTQITFFAHMKDSGLGAPTHVGFDTLRGPRIGTNGAPIDASGMAACWVVAWFAGAQGWTNWDSPWAVFLQHKPKAMRLDEDGLHFEFRQPAGDLVMMPLYGYYKPPSPGKDFLVQHGLPGKKITTWEWEKFLPRELLMRVRYWAGATREMPITCDETFSVDGAKDTVTIRHRFEWLSLDDDWRTPHLKMAPVSPVLALATKAGKFPVKFSRKPLDLEMPTPYGPYLSVEGVNSFDVTLDVLKYVNETEAADSPRTNAHPLVARAMVRLRELLPVEPEEPYFAAKALPYLEPEMRKDVAARTRAVLSKALSRAEILMAQMERTGGQNTEGDLERHLFKVGLSESLWAYSHATGDWSLAQQSWPVMKKLLSGRAGVRWAWTPSVDHPLVGDGAAHCLAVARMAHRLGDTDTYNRACHRFARELAHQHAMRTGAEYFRKQQPWHSMVAMPEGIHLESSRQRGSGWDFDAPGISSGATHGVVEDRWVSLHDADVGRFHRNVLPAEVKAQLARMPPREAHSTARVTVKASSVELRFLLLSENTAQLANAVADASTLSLADCLAVIRSSRPARYERLVPLDRASAFTSGMEPTGSALETHLIHEVQRFEPGGAAGGNAPVWPRLAWVRWQTSTGAPWNFGQVVPAGQTRPHDVREIPLNRSTRIVTYSLP